jgi:hypothetical protein
VFLGAGEYQLEAHETVEKYWTVARTSTGATVAAWR